MELFRNYLLKENSSGLDTNWGVLADALEEHRNDVIMSTLFQALKEESQFSLQNSLSKFLDPRIIPDEEIERLFPDRGNYTGLHLSPEDVENLRIGLTSYNRKHLSGWSDPSSFPYSDVLRNARTNPELLTVLRKANERHLGSEVESISRNIDKYYKSRKLFLSLMTWEGEFSDHLLSSNRFFLSCAQLGVPFVGRFSHMDRLVKLFKTGGFSSGFNKQDWSGFDRNAKD